MDMKTDIFVHYDFDEQDAIRLKEMAPIMEGYKDHLADDFYRYLLRFKDTADLLPDQEAIDVRKKTMKKWFMEVFSGKYNQEYLENLRNIGYTHKKIELDGHYVNAAMNFIRNFCLEVLDKEIENPITRGAVRNSLQKILDINLDVMTSSYREAELAKVFVSRSVEKKLVNFSERFSYGLNMIVVIGLVGLSLAVVAMFVLDVFEIFTGNVSHGVITSLGTLLILWVMIELMYTQIDHLKGGKFSLRIFAEVGLVTFLRDTLVASLNHESVEKLVILAGIVLALAVVYWIIVKAEAQQSMLKTK